MTTYVALIYSVVLPAGQRLKMVDLQAVALGLGLRDPRTVGATGNLIFESDDEQIPELEQRLETAFAARFGKHVPIIIRSSAAWQRLVRANPFSAEAAADPAKVAVRVMRSAIPKSAQTAMARYVDDERIAIIRGDLWIHFPGDATKSRLISALNAGRLEGVGTFRNANTIGRIGEALLRKTA
jgi:uncharacterized protein (DUF1697 family)